MGNVQAITTVFPWEWKNEPSDGIGGNYDDAGYIPPGLTYPPQNSWNEALNYGGDTHMRQYDTTYPKITYGITEGLLTSFGTIGQPGGYPQLYDETYGYPGGYMTDGEFVSIKNQPVPYASGKLQWKPNPDSTDLQTCTPETFPNCTMTAMMEGGGEASFYNGVTQTAGRIYAESVNRAYTKAFIGGGVEALTQVNTAEHSTFDPCSEPGLLETLLPLAAAVASVAVYTYYGKPELTLALGSQTAEAGTIIIFGFMYNYSKGLLEYVNESTNIHFERAARWLVYPLAIYAGAQGGNVFYLQTDQQANEEYFQIGGALVAVKLSESFLVMPIAHALSAGGAVAGILLGGFGFLMRGISGFWCRLSTNQDSCAINDSLPEFQDSRRWDAVSIAAMLTLEACEREGWQKDDPRAQFVFRALLSGPAMMTAPMTTQETPDIFDQTLANPLGYTYAGRWQQNIPTNLLLPTTFQRSANVYGWDGDVAGWGNLANSNLYSCENWGVMREGLQQNTHPGTKALKRKFDSWIGTWQDPDKPGNVGTLIAAANIPANIEAMKHIPGWQLEDAIGIHIPLKEAPFLNPVTNLDLEQPLHFEQNTEGTFVDLWSRLTTPIFGATPLESPVYDKPPIERYNPNYCAGVWTNDILQGAGGWSQMSAGDVQTNLENILASGDCASCPVNDIGKLYVLRLALSDSQGLTCVEFVSVLDKLGWDASVINTAVHTIAEVTESKIPALSQWAALFLLNCGYRNQQGAPFSSLPSSITSKWCT